MQTTPRLLLRAAAFALTAAAGTLAGVPAGAQPPRTPLPFAIGERLTYEARAGRVGGRAEMWVDGPVDVRGASAMVLHFTFSAKVGPLGVSDETTSWWDPARRATLRFQKRERHLLARHTESVELPQGSRHWRADDGREGVSPTDAPLDELSFIYVIRTLEFGADSTLRLERHFDADRNPTTVRFIGRASVTTPLGTFATREVEMRVRDARNYRGQEGVIRFSISDDACRRPVRIASDIPGAGKVVMTLVAASPALADCAAHAAPPAAP